MILDCSVILFHFQDLKDEKKKAKMAAARAVLEKCTMMLLTASKVKKNFCYYKLILNTSNLDILHFLKDQSDKLESRLQQSNLSYSLIRVLITSFPNSKQQFTYESALIEQLSKRWLIRCYDSRPVAHGHCLQSFASLAGKPAHVLQKKLGKLESIK